MKRILLRLLSYIFKGKDVALLTDKELDVLMILLEQEARTRLLVSRRDKT